MAVTIKAQAAGQQLSAEWQERMRLGQLAFEKGIYKEASRQFAKALEQCGTSDPRTSITALNLAVSFGAAGRDDLADPFFEKALRLDEQALPADCVELAVDFIDIGAHYARIDDFGRAEQMYSKALSILEASPERDKQADLALTLNNLGLLYLDQGQHGKAESALQRALDIRQRIFLKDSREVAESLLNLANLKHSTGEDDLANNLYQRAIAMLEVRIGPGHPELIDALQDYADFLAATGNVAKADITPVRVSRPGT